METGVSGVGLSPTRYFGRLTVDRRGTQQKPEEVFGSARGTRGSRVTQLTSLTALPSPLQPGREPSVLNFSETPP